MVVAEVFGDIQNENVKSCAPFFAASLVYHHNYLKTTLPETHPLWGTPYSRLSPSRIADLQKSISVESSGAVVATGIPSTVAILANQKKAAEEREVRGCD